MVSFRKICFDIIMLILDRDELDLVRIGFNESYNKYLKKAKDVKF
jgi:hypothetical protein